MTPMATMGSGVTDCSVSIQPVSHNFIFESLEPYVVGFDIFNYSDMVCTHYGVCTAPSSPDKGTISA